ncbi:hypothetical protein WJX72_000623 [[Myrmecia] bisecta]|uniref:Uncharacterized protein n=1 Tax=[Myrmecia] bisecta TaxID=41462 RepID=A0AAW1QE00_9CHLO
MEMGRTAVSCGGDTVEDMPEAMDTATDLATHSMQVTLSARGATNTPAGVDSKQLSAEAQRPAANATEPTGTLLQTAAALPVQEDSPKAAEARVPTFQGPVSTARVEIFQSPTMVQTQQQPAGAAKALLPVRRRTSRQPVIPPADQFKEMSLSLGKLGALDKAGGVEDYLQDSFDCDEDGECACCPGGRRIVFRTF